MCAVSAVYDYYRQNVPITQWTPDTFSEMQEIIRRLDELDRKLDQHECHDPAKAEWVRDVEERLQRIEEK